jgi:hypothetical protein
VAVLAGASVGWSATPDDCHVLRKHGHEPEAQKCYEALSVAHEPYLRAEGYWGLENYQEANNQFRLAVDQSPANATRVLITRTPPLFSGKRWKRIRKARAHIMASGW